MTSCGVLLCYGTVPVCCVVFVFLWIVETTIPELIVE